MKNTIVMSVFLIAFGLLLTFIALFQTNWGAGDMMVFVGTILIIIGFAILFFMDCKGKLIDD
jgi:hypothetical protein